MTPTCNILHANAIGDAVIASTSLTYMEGVQAQIDAISNNKYGAIGP